MTWTHADGRAEKKAFDGFFGSNQKRMQAAFVLHELHEFGSAAGQRWPCSSALRTEEEELGSLTLNLQWTRTKLAAHKEP